MADCGLEFLCKIPTIIDYVVTIRFFSSPPTTQSPSHSLLLALPCQVPLHLFPSGDIRLLLSMCAVELEDMEKSQGAELCSAFLTLLAPTAHPDPATAATDTLREGSKRMGRGAGGGRGSPSASSFVVVNAPM